MKRFFTCIGGLLLSFAFVSVVYAGAIDNRTNWSAEWVRTLNRNAATDYADIAMYNPAGTVKLHEGFTLNGSVQFGMKDYANNVTLPGFIPNLGCTKCESDEPSIIPGFFGVYNKSKWSLFGAFANVAGGGKVDFEQGSWTTIEAQLGLVGPPVLPQQQITGESFYLGYTLGAAYAFNDMFSFSVGLRYVDASREISGFAQTYALDVEEEGDGWGGIFGANIAPNDKLNIGIRYETKTDIDLEATVKQDTSVSPPYPAGATLAGALLGVTNGQERPRDLPAVLGLGASYRLTPKLRTEVNLTYYFNEDANWGGDEDDADNGYDIGIAFEYNFTDKIIGSIGYMYTKYGMDDPADMLSENPELDVNTIGAGIAYVINEKIHTNFSIANSFYKDESFSPSAPMPPGITVEYEKNILFVAVGVEYRF